MAEHIIVPDRIILMRHGHALTSLGDHDFGLTSKGVQQVENVVDQWIAAGIRINAIRHSPKLRAKETALIAAQKAGLKLTQVAVSTSLEGDGARIAPAVEGLEGIALVVSHGPEVYTFIGAHTDRKDHDIVKHAEAFVIERNGKEWEPQERSANHRIVQAFSPR